LDGNGFFHDSCFYLEASDDKYDINKLVGLSAYFFHHIESVRIGFRTNTKDITLMDLFLYAYDDKTRMKEVFICSVAATEWFSFKVEIRPESFVATVNGIERQVARTRANTSEVKYLLFPYYGGNQKAKQDMRITLIM
jgi:hypothetical protein